MTYGYHATDRAVLRVSGAEARDFLQGLVTNDVGGWSAARSMRRCCRRRGSTCSIS